jgi:hypothetical protein
MTIKLGDTFYGGAYAGVTTALDGRTYAVVRLPGLAENVTWEAAKRWVEEQGGKLPSLRESRLTKSTTWAEDVDQYGAAGIYDAERGNQYFVSKDHELQAIAVRLVPVAVTFGDME